MVSAEPPKKWPFCRKKLREGRFRPDEPEICVLAFGFERLLRDHFLTFCAFCLAGKFRFVQKG